MSHNLTSEDHEKIMVQAVTNERAIYCRLCNEIILKAHVGLESKVKEVLPDANGNLIMIENWWEVNDVFKFENIGVSKEVTIPHYHHEQGSIVNIDQAAEEQSLVSTANAVQVSDKNKKKEILKFLTCANCEKEVVGFGLSEISTYYIAKERIKE